LGPLHSVPDSPIVSDRSYDAPGLTDPSMRCYVLALGTAEPRVVREALQSRGIQALWILSMPVLRERLYDEEPSLVIVTVDELDSSHLVLLADIRPVMRAPLFVVSEISSIEMRIGAFDAGADEHLPSTASPEEFVARIDAKLRRAARTGTRTAPRA
jgi:DNA-binding response OmpR family regulator